jgi:hypothetical protein
VRIEARDESDTREQKQRQKQKLPMRKKQKQLDTTSRLIEAPEGIVFIASTYLCNQFQCTASKVHIKKWPVILSEAYFSGVEGPAFGMLVARDSA